MKNYNSSEADELKDYHLSEVEEEKEEEDEALKIFKRIIAEEKKNDNLA